MTTDPIPFAPPDITDDDIQAVSTVLRSGWLTTGAEALGLEQDLAEMTHAPYVVAMSSCTTALQACFASLRLPAGSRIGVPDWTFVSTANSARAVGLRPVLLDVDPDTLNVTADAVAAEADLDALCIVHYAGVPVDGDVLAAADDRGLPVVEDAAHALGAVDARGPVSGVGTVGACFSFYATKNLTSAEGGAIATHDEELAAFAQAYRLHGLSRDAWRRYEPGASATYDVVVDGIKANLPDVLAAIARSQLRRFPSMQAHRAVLAQRYRKRLASIAGVRPVPSTHHEGSANHLMPICLDSHLDRRTVIDRLTAAGVATSIHFQPLHRFSRLAEQCDVGRSGLDTAEELADRVLSLPLSSTHTAEQVDRVCDALIEAVG